MSPSVAVCAIFKDEARDLAEWVAYHRIVGVDHFVLYDNDSSDGGAAVLSQGPLKENVTIIPFPARPGQMKAYQHFIENYAGNWDWTAFIDVDEFIHPVETNCVKTLLAQYDRFSAVLLHWLNFGPNGHMQRPPGLVVENYTRRVSKEYDANRTVKSLIRAAEVVDLVTSVHVFSVKGPVCNARGEEVANEPVQQSVCHDVMCVNHYYTKSRQEWTEKVQKGRADAGDHPQVQRLSHWFDEYFRVANVSDERLTRFAGRINQILATSLEGR